MSDEKKIGSELRLAADLSRKIDPSDTVRIQERVMSDDIVIKVKPAEGSTADLLYKAAVEIERLREQNEYLKANVEMLLAEAKAMRGE